MTWWFVPVIVLVIASVGFVTILKKILDLNNRINLLVVFLNKFVNLSNKYFEKNKLDQKLYNWLIDNVDEVQNMLGSVGVISYKPPFANYMHTDYLVVINTIPQFKAEGPHPHDISLIESLLRRVISSFNKSKSNLNKQLKNPLKWLTEGIKFVLSIPLYLLEQVGVVSQGTVLKIQKNGIFKLIIAILSFIGILETVLGLITRKSLVAILIEKLFK